MGIAIVLWGILFYLAMIYTSKALVMLTFFTAAYLVLSYFFLAIRRSGMYCELRIPISVMDEGGKLSLEIELNAKTFFGVSRLRFHLMVRNTFSGQQKKVCLKAVQEKQGSSIYSYMLTLPEAGHYEISLRKVRFYDSFGILSMKRRQKAHGNVQVLPRLRQIPVQISSEVRRFYGESEVYDDERAGTAPGELFGFRPFAPGDRLQNIHWKLSAKEDELIVRENSQPKACAVVLFLDYCGRTSGRKAVRFGKKIKVRRKLENKDRSSRKIKSEGKEKKKNKTIKTANTAKTVKTAKSAKTVKAAKAKGNAGKFLEIAASLSFSLLDMDCPHYVSWYNGKEQNITRVRVDDEESFYTFLARYLNEQGSGAPGPVRELYREKYTTEHYLHSLLLTQEMVLYQDEEKLLDLAGRGGMKQLEKTEIIM